MILVQIDQDGIYSVCIQDGSDFYQICHDGMNLLQLAVRDNQESLVRFLMAEEVDPNEIPSQTDYPINLAIKNKNLAIIQLLLQARANVLIKDHTGMTALDYAVESNDEMIQSIMQMASIEQQIEIATRGLYFSRRLPIICEEQFKRSVETHP